MAVNPPYQLIAQLAQMKAQTPSNLSLVMDTLGKGIQRYKDFKSQQQQQDKQSVSSLLTSGDLLPPDPNKPQGQGMPTFGDLLKATNQGRVPAGIPPQLLSMSWRPKADLGNLARFAPYLPENTPIPTPMGGTAPKTNPPAKGKSPAIDPQDRIFNESKTTAQQFVQNQIKQAQADTAGSMAGKYPVLDPFKQHQMFLDKWAEIAQGQGAKPDEIKKRIGGLQSKLQDVSSGYAKDLTAAKQVVKSGRLSSQEAQQRLIQKYPELRQQIQGDPDLSKASQPQSKGVFDFIRQGVQQVTGGQ